MSRVIVIGGDGFSGWPLALRLSAEENTVLIIDNLSRRLIDTELDTASLTPIAEISDRLRAWTDLTGRCIEFENVNVAMDLDKLCSIVRTFKPKTIFHLGEQRSAPYSMKNEKNRQYTMSNNISATHNVLIAVSVVDPDIHIVHLGTMGVYGYGIMPDCTIPEGYLTVKIQDDHGVDQSVDILHPAHPGSVYHLTKTQDALMFQFYARNYRLRITDLHQGIIWGVATNETRLHPALENRFDYDGDYGTVMNRFILQATLNLPMSVYGSGDQTRAFIHISDSVRCMVTAMQHPPERGDRVCIFNQCAQTLSLLQLTQLIADVVPNTRVTHETNPRVECAQNNLIVCNQQFRDYGVDFITFSTSHISDIVDVVSRYRDRLRPERLAPTSFWRGDLTAS